MRLLLLYSIYEETWRTAKWEFRLDTEEPIIIPSSNLCFGADNDLIARRMRFKCQRMHVLLAYKESYRY